MDTLDTGIVFVSAYDLISRNSYAHMFPQYVLPGVARVLCASQSIKPLTLYILIFSFLPLPKPSYSFSTYFSTFFPSIFRYRPKTLLL